MRMQLKFNVAPRPGEVEMALDDQIYRLVEVRPYVRKMDGAATDLLIWATNCPDCRARMEVTSSKTSAHKVRRRCDDCASNKPVRPRRRWGSRT